MSSWISNKRIWKYSPLVCTLLLEGSTIGHLLRMWTEHTAAGQSFLSWIYVFIALALWMNWYRLYTPEQKTAIYSTMVGMTTCAAGILTIVYLRYL